MPADKHFLINKLNSSGKYLGSLKKVLLQSQPEFAKDLDSQLKGERVFEILVQIMVDVCTHIVAHSTEPTPASYGDCMLALSRLNILNQDFAEKCVQIVKMRNLITHQYDIIDYNMLYAGLQTLQRDFEIYQKKILSWLKALQ